MFGLQRLALLAAALSMAAPRLHAAEAVVHPYRGITIITRTETTPRQLSIHLVAIDLTASGISFKLTAPSGTLETVRQTTLEFLKQEHAQVAINAHFFLPFPSTSTAADLVGFAASNGAIFSEFEKPSQSYAIVDYAPAINLDRRNHARLVHYDPRYTDGKRLREHVKVWTAIAGSAQIITNGVRTIPAYNAQLTPGGPRQYSDTNSWYDALQARTAIGLSRNKKTLYLFTVDRAGGSLGMRVGEVADLLIRHFAVYNALNLDGGGSTSLAIEDPATHKVVMVNQSSDRPEGRLVGSNLAVFARPSPAR